MPSGFTEDISFFLYNKTPGAIMLELKIKDVQLSRFPFADDLCVKKKNKIN